MLKEVLIAEDSVRICSVLQRVLERMDVVGSAQVAGSLDAALRMMHERHYDVLITGTLGTDTFPVLDGLERGSEACPDFYVAIAEQSDITILQKAIEKGCFHFVKQPFTAADVSLVLSRMGWDFPGQFLPRVYAFAGTKCVGKSETQNFLMKYVPRFRLVGKYSSRMQEARDAIYGDTRPLASLAEPVEENIHWQSYGDTCCIRVAEIKEVLDAGYDCGVAIGQADGVRSLLHHFPNAYVTVIIAADDLVKTILSGRPGNKVPLERTLEAQGVFKRSFPEFIYPNRTFFEVPVLAAKEIRSFRKTNAP